MAEDESITSGGSLGLRAGSRFGNYRLKRLLGKGGFGHVWEAEDTVMDRVVALKLLRSEYSENETFRLRLFREARAAGRLHEPHVVPIHQCGEIDGQIYIDMRLVDGTDLESVLAREGPLPPARAVAVVRQIAAALDAAHDAGLIHRDVKPANILLAYDDFACLLDFGLANAVSDAKLTTTGFTIGTFAYMAPERLSADAEVDHRVDVYALACVLYECLTGSRPYLGDMPALVTAHLTAPIPHASQQHPGIPAALDDIIARGMAKTAADRYGSAGEFARAAQFALKTKDQIQADAIAASAQAPTLSAAELMTSARGTDLPTEHARVQPTSDPKGAPPTMPGTVQSNHDPDHGGRIHPDRRSPWPGLMIAALLAVVGLAIAVTVFAIVRPRAAPLVVESALGGLLLSPGEVDNSMGITGMTPRGGRGVLPESTVSATTPSGCRAPITEEAHAYSGSGSTASLHEQLWNAKPNSPPTHIVSQAVVLFPSAQTATDFLNASVSEWSACANKTISTTYANGKSSSATTGPVSSASSILSVTLREDDVTGQHALTSSNNVIVDVTVGNVLASGLGGVDEAVRIAGRIAAKVPH
ncbi:serine/threonine-protein kinase PknH/PknJ [Mycobacterium sp. 050128]|uniref:serine/threonine-protein kinase PknH/PknJ n=1 Tax=Mycobacterium sp. 050128 TaxID=3096112 RepID=UPI002EDB0143